MTILKVDISDDLYVKLDNLADHLHLSKKQLVETILSAYFSDSSARTTLFGFDILMKMFDEI